MNEINYNFETEALTACLAFANTPRSFLHSLLRQDVVADLAKSLTPDQLGALARRAALQPSQGITDFAVAYAAIVALAKKNFTKEINSQLSALSGLPLPWTTALIREIRDYAVPTVVADLTPKTDRDSALLEPIMVTSR